MASESTAQKKGGSVFAVSQYSRIAYAASVMHEHKVGCLVVTGDGGEAVGILSERDVLRWIGTATPQAYMQKVCDIMTKDFVAGQPGITCQEAQEIMRSHKIRHLPIVEDGFAVGMVSMRDLLAETEPESVLHAG